MQIGLMFFASSKEVLIGDKYRLVMKCAKFADEHGFSSVWVPERHFTKLGCLYPNPAVLHAALARETKQIRLQAGSVVLPLHNPIRIAEEWAMVDNLSGGRVGISFASGWNPNDFAFFPERYKNRHQELFSGIQTVQKLWQGESIQVTSGHGEQHKVRIYPTPIQQTLPVWVTAAGNPQTFIKAGEIGANLLTHLLDQGMEELAKKISLYRQARAAQGHDPAAGQVTVMLHTFVGEDATTVREQVRTPYCEYLKSNVSLLKDLAQGRGSNVDLTTLSSKELDAFTNFLYERFATSRGLIGTPETCLPLLSQLAEVGVDEIACLLDFGPKEDLILANLPYLNQLKECYASQALTNFVSVQNGASVQQEKNGSLGNIAAATGKSLIIEQKNLNRLHEIQARCEEVSVSDFYHGLHDRGVELDDGFQGIERLWRGQGEALGQVQLLKALEPTAESYNIHPAFLDACFHVVAATLPTDCDSFGGSTCYLPMGMQSLRIYGRMGKWVWSHAVLRSATEATTDTFEADVQIFDEGGNLIVNISGLRLQRVESIKHSTQEYFKDWLYEIQWEPKQPRKSDPLPSQQPGSWLIFADNSGIGEKLAELLKARGETCFMVSWGAAQEVSEVGQFWIDPSRPVQMHQLIQNILGFHQPHCRGIVHLWSLDAMLSQQTTVASLEKDQVLGVASTLYLIQALAQTTTKQPPRVWSVTRGAQPHGLESFDLAIAQAPLWGLGRVISVEYPHLWGGLVDLEPGSPLDKAAEQLLNVIWNPDGEEQVAFRKDQEYVARLRHVRNLLPSKQLLRLLSDATYLITGGLGGLGIKVAQWMVEQGARNLVLVGRSGASNTVSETLSQLEQLGVRVVLARADVTDQEQIGRVIAEIGQSLPPLHGVVHLAGVLDDGLLAQQDWERFTKVRASKVEGAWNLHVLTQNHPLDFFVLFSSAACLVPMPGQGNYATANAFLDALAHHRRALGQPALSINWGPWSEVGFVTTSYGRKAHERLALLGIESIAPNRGLQMLELLLQQDSSQIGVVSVNWSQLLQADLTALKSSLLSELTHTARPQTEKLKAQQWEILKQLEAAPTSDRHSLLIAYLQEQSAKVLGLSASQLDLQQPLNYMGLDSNMVMELRNRLIAELGVDIPIVKFMEDISVTSLAMQISEQLIEIEFTSSASLATGAISSLGKEKITQIDISKEVHPENGRQHLPLKAITCPLSFAQQRLWFLEQFKPGNGLYNIPVEVRLIGQLNVSILEESLNHIISRHEVLRTHFATQEGQPIQVIASALTLTLPVVDLRELSECERELAVQRLATQEAVHSFDIATAPLVRATLLQLTETEHVLLLVMHHIVTDGWSMNVLINEVSILYTAFLTGTPSPLAELPLQYSDYACWQRQWLQGEVLESQIFYWKQQLGGSLPILELPTDRPRPAVQTFCNGIERFEIDADLTQKLKILSQNSRTTLFMTLLATFVSLLSRYSNQEDIIVGTDIANRNRLEIEGLIGFFVNQLVLRIDVSGNPTFRELLFRVRQVVMGAYAHQDLPFDKLVEVLKPQRDLSRTPLFQVKLVFQKAPTLALNLPNLTMTTLEIDKGVTQNDLILFLWESQQGLRGSFEYNKDLFDATTISLMSEHLITLLGSISTQPDTQLKALEMLTEMEKRQQAMEKMERKSSNLNRLKNIKPKMVSLLPQDELIKTDFLKTGETLPLILRPAVDDIDLVAWTKSNQQFLETKLLKHGAIVFRGFTKNLLAVFEQFALTICSELFNENGEHPREQVSSNVYTPVFYPSEQKVLLHNENSFNHSWPMKIWFGCVQPAQQGGETPVVDSRKVFELLDPKIKEQFMQKQIMYVRNYGEGLGLSWQTVFQTSDKSKVEEHCRKNFINFEWNDGDRLRTYCVRPAVVKHPKTGEISWFNQAQHWHFSCLPQATRESLLALFSEEYLPRTCYYGDGSRIEDSVMQEIYEIYEQLEISFPWEAGDILMLDNMLVAHGRNPFLGERKIIVALGEMRSYANI